MLVVPVQVTVWLSTGDVGAHAACARSTAAKGAISSASVSATATATAGRRTGQFGTALFIFISCFSAELGWLEQIERRKP